MKKRQKILNCEIKEVNDEDRSFLAVASTEDIDRSNDRIMSTGWDLGNFLKNPVIPWAHRYSDPPVARAASVFVQDGKLMFKPKFATADEYPFADTIYKLYKGGFLQAFSVGFNPRRYEVVERQKGSRGYDFIEQELWEISACTVPANPNALVAAVEKGIINDSEKKSFEEQTDLTDRSDLADLAEIEKRLNELEQIAKSLVGIEKKLDAWLALQEKPDQVTVKNETHGQPEAVVRATETPSPEEIRAAASEAVKAAINELGSIVDSKIKYHMGIVD